MNRYKIKKADYPAAKKYLTGKAFKKDSPNWVVKFKDDLVFRGGEVFFKGDRVIPEEDVDAYLRDKVYNQKSDMPLSRDGAHHFIKKNKIIGISRARLMKFLRAQPAISSTRSAKNAPRDGGGGAGQELQLLVRSSLCSEGRSGGSQPTVRGQDRQD